MSGALPDRDERGETLVELIVSVAILGIAAVAILSGLLVSVKTSDQQRRESTSGAYVRSWAEAIQSTVDTANALSNCAGYETIFNDLKLENPALMPLSPACTASTANGIQRVKLTVTSSGDAAHAASESLDVVIRTPCNAAGANPCGT